MVPLAFKRFGGMPPKDPRQHKRKRKPGRRATAFIEAIFPISSGAVVLAMLAAVATAFA